jgi:hypothetical protein
MHKIGDFILAFIVSETSILLLTCFVIAFYSSHYDPKDEVICRVRNEDQEMWRKCLENDRSKAFIKTQIKMSYVAVFIAFCYWLAKLN